MTKEEKAKYYKEYREKNKERISLKAKIYYQENKRTINERHSRNHKLNKGKDNERNRLNYLNNISVMKKKHSEYRKENKEEIAKYAKEYRIKYLDKNRERNREYARTHKLDTKKYRIKNKEKINKSIRANIKNRIKNDKLFYFKKRTRGLISGSWKRKGTSKNSKTEKILGCSFDEFRIYLESLFEKGMSWGRFSEIHIDHIIPLSLAKNNDEVLKLCHYSNLQPLWAIDNLKKGSKLNYT